MPESLPVYLKKRAMRSFHYFQQQIQDLAPAQTLRFREAAWPDHPWGIGQDGSIAGIVFHVAAWKQMTLSLFRAGDLFIGREAFDFDSVPAKEDWPGLMSWLDAVGKEWNTRLENLPDAAFDEIREWDGVTITVAKYVTEMLEHDIQHAAQIEYLRQRLTMETLSEAQSEASSGDVF